MANMSLKKNPMPSQDPNVRNKNFEEVALGYTEEQALDEAARCLNCKNKPCMQGCPVMVHIPDFIAEVAKGDFEAAYQPLRCPQSAAVSARRRASARSIASAVSRVSLSALAVWSASWPTGIASTPLPPRRSPPPTATAWQWWAPVPPA